MAGTLDSPGNERTIKEIDFTSIELIEVVGEGSFGVVYKGLWDSKYVAVKQISNPKKDTIAVEVRQLSRIDHENIVKLHGACTAGLNICLVMEYAEGGSLFNVLHSSRYVHYNLGHALSWLHQCAKGVEYLHGMQPKPLIHRDLKPPNLLLIDGGTWLKICDFGTAADKSTYMTNNKGSAAWMAPEVFSTNKYTEKCDIFSWGVILWEVLSRRRPFYSVGGSAFSILWQVYRGIRPPLVRGCPQILETIMTKCWDNNPANRPDMSQLVRVMAKLCALAPDGREPVAEMDGVDWHDELDMEEEDEDVDIDSDDTAADLGQSLSSQSRSRATLQHLGASESSARTGMETNRSERVKTLPQPVGDEGKPLQIGIDPNAWELPGSDYGTAMELQTMAGFDRMVPKNESTIYRPPDHPDGMVGDPDNDPDLDNFYMLLDPHLRPASPDLNDPNSIALFNEHKHLAQEYLKVQTEIALLSQKKDKLLAAQTVEQQKTHDNMKRLQNEKEQLLLFKDTLMKQQEILQDRNGHDEWVLLPR